MIHDSIHCINNNLLGQEMISKSVNKEETTIDVTHLNAGTYLLKLLRIMKPKR